MKTATRLKRKHQHRSVASSPMRAALNAMKAEIESAAQKLGYDVSKRNWSKALLEETREYPCTLEGEEYLCLSLMLASAGPAFVPSN
jgi:hypothetical protein